MKSQLELRNSPSIRLRANEQIMTAPMEKQHDLLAELRKMKRSGEILEAYNWTEAGGQVGVIIERNPNARRRMSPARRATALSLAVVMAVAGVGWLVWESRAVLIVAAMCAAGAFLAACVIVVVHVAFSSGAGCSCVVHGSSCR
jgi:hypothetical protein